MSDVIDLDEERAKRSGASFGFTPWEFDDEALGFTHGDYPVVLVLDGNEGICMTRETTTKLRDALTAALESEHAPWAGEVTP